MAASDEQTRVLRWFRAPTLKVALGIAGLARRGINKMVQAVSADPTTEFCSVLSLPSPWWSWQKCIKAGTKRGSEITKVQCFKFGNIWSSITYNSCALLQCTIFFHREVWPVKGLVFRSWQKDPRLENGQGTDAKNCVDVSLQHSEGSLPLWSSICTIAAMSEWAEISLQEFEQCLDFETEVAAS